MGNWNMQVGLNHVGAYQVSGKPWASGSIDCKSDTKPHRDLEITFPYVARWFKVVNKDESNTCKVAFSLAGLTGSTNNYFTVGAADFEDGHGLSDSGVLELKVSSIWISGSTDVDIIAGLTSIEAFRTQTSEGANWSGSAGVS
jgi:hypothetical protein